MNLLKLRGGLLFQVVATQIFFLNPYQFEEYFLNGLKAPTSFDVLRLFQHTFGTHPEQPVPTGYKGISFIV